MVFLLHLNVNKGPEPYTPEHQPLAESHEQLTPAARICNFLQYFIENNP